MIKEGVRLPPQLCSVYEVWRACASRESTDTTALLKSQRSVREPPNRLGRSIGLIAILGTLLLFSVVNFRASQRENPDNNVRERVPGPLNAFIPLQTTGVPAASFSVVGAFTRGLAPFAVVFVVFL